MASGTRLIKITFAISFPRKIVDEAEITQTLLGVPYQMDIAIKHVEISVANIQLPQFQDIPKLRSDNRQISKKLSHLGFRFLIMVFKS